MSIQSNINQNLSLASLLLTQSPTVKKRVEDKRIANTIEARALDAERGLADIQTDIDEGKFGVSGETTEGEPVYSDTELRDTKKRMEDYYNSIYEAKVARLNPSYSRFMKPESEALDRKALLKQRKSIESRIEGTLKLRAFDRAKARARAQDALVDQIDQKQASKNFAKSITEDEGGTNV